MRQAKAWNAFNTTVWMHPEKANKTYKEKAWRELHKNATSYIEQILEQPRNNCTATYFPSLKPSK